MDSRLFRYAFVVIGFVVSLVTITTMETGAMGNFDFDLYFFAGQLEQHSTFTDTNALFARMDALGVHHLTDGAYGAPPLVALVFQPLSLIPIDIAHVLWNLLTAAALVAAFRKAVPNSWWLVWLALVLFSPAMLLGLQLQNFSVLTLCLLAYAYGAARHGDQRATGIALGIAAAFKLYPIFIIVALFFLGRRSGPTLRWALGTGAITVVFSLPALGIHDIVPAYQALFDVAGTMHKQSDNVGLPGFVLNQGGTSNQAKLVNVIASLLAFLALYRSRRLSIASFVALATCLMLVSQSISWVEYLPMLILGLWSLCSFEVRRFVVGVACACFALAVEFQRYLSLYEHMFAISTAASLAFCLILLFVGLRSKVRESINH